MWIGGCILNGEFVGGYDKRKVWVYQWHVRLIKWVQENHMNLRVFLHLFSRHSIAGLKCRVSIMCIGDPICFVQVWGVNHHARESATPNQVPHHVWVFSFHMFQDCTYVFTVRGTFLYTYVHPFFTSYWTSGPTWSQWCSLFIIRGEDSSLPLQELLDSRFKLLLALLNIHFDCYFLLLGSSRVVSPFGESTYIGESTEEMLPLVGWSDTTLSFPNILGTTRLFAGYFLWGYRRSLKPWEIFSIPRVSGGSIWRFGPPSNSISTTPFVSHQGMGSMASIHRIQRHWVTGSRGVLTRLTTCRGNVSWRSAVRRLGGQKNKLEERSSWRSMW